MSTPTAPAKVCEICKQDCTSKPRIKDGEGHYFCRECVDKRKAARSAQGPTPAARTGAAPATALATDDDRGIMAKLVDDSIKKSTDACPGCRRPLKPEAIVCTQCGFNRQTSQLVTTQVLKAQEVTGPKEKKGRRNIEISPGMVLLLLLLVYGGLFAGAMGNPIFLALLIVAVGAASLVAFIMAIVGAFQDGDGGWAITGIVGIVVPFVSIAFLIYVFFVSERGLVKALYLANLIGAVLYIVAIFQFAQSGDLGSLQPG